MMIDCERVLVSESLDEELNRSEDARRNVSVSKTVLPPLRIREPTSGSSVLEISFRWREEEIAKGKGKEKLAEYADEVHHYTDGGEFESEQAAVIMTSNRESVMFHQDEQFENLILDARTGSENRLMNCSDNIMEQIAKFCVKINEKHRWSRKEIQVNQILREYLLHLVNEKAPKVHMNPFNVFYRTKFAENSNKFGTINLNKTSTGVPGLKFILKQILSSPKSQERIAAVQKLHVIIVHKERSRDMHVRIWISLANVSRVERGGSLIYLAFDENVREAIVVGQEAGETGGENESETEDTVNTSVTEATVNNPEVIVSEAVVSRTKDTIMEPTVNEAAVATGGTDNRETEPMEVEVTINTKATINEGIPTETEAIVNQTTPFRTESTVESTLSSEEELRKTEDEVPSIVMKSRRKTFRELIQEKGAHRIERMKIFRTKRKPKVLSKYVHTKIDAKSIQGIFENSFDSMKEHMIAQIREVGIEYDNDGNFLGYTLHHPTIDGHVNQTKFDKNFKNHRGNHTRSIYFFELLRMIEILEDDDFVTLELLEPIYEYYNLRERQHREVYGYWRYHDDDGYLSPANEDQAEDTPDEVIDSTTDDENDQLSHSTQGNTSEAQKQRYSTSSYQDQQNQLLNLYIKVNKDFSSRPGYIPRVVDNPLRYQGMDEETHFKSLLKLKTSVL
ncbi:hypothetical protein ACET3Z_013168 [Daucus carota]